MTLRLNLSETPLDGPNWLLANKVLWVDWRSPGGDWLDRNGAPQGAEPWAKFKPTAAGFIEVDVLGLVRHLQATGNQGLILHKIAGAAVAFKSEETEGTDKDPVIICDGVVCPCAVDVQIAPSSAYPIDLENLQLNALMRFDLSGAPANPAQAKLRIYVATVYAGLPPEIAVDALDMPLLVTDPAEVGPTKEAEATKADLITYDDLVSEDAIKRGYLVVTPTSVGGIEFERDQRGFTWAKCYGDGTGQRAVAWHKWAQPKNSPPTPNAAWKRDYVAGEAHGYDEMSLQFMIRIGQDLREAFNELGMKLPGLAGTYDWSSSGARTEPPPGRDGTWEARLWHSGRSDAHPHLYRGAIYWYGADHPFTRFQGQGKVRFFNRANFCFRAGQDYRCEEKIKLNTIRPDGTAVADGVIQVYIDKVLMHEETGVLIRKYRHAQIQDLPFVNIYHGGMGKPKGRYHIALGRFITATKYIGSLADAVVEEPEEPQEPGMDDLDITVGGVAYELYETPDDPTCMVIEGKRYSVRRKLTTPPPQWQLSDPRYDSNVTEYGACQPDGFRYRTEKWVRDVITQGEGEPPLPLEFEQEGKQACTYVPPPTGEVVPQHFDVAPGGWRNASLNTGVQAGVSESNMNTWNGGCRVPWTGKYGTVVRKGGRQHGTGHNDPGGCVAWDLDENLIKVLNRPAHPHQQGVFSTPKPSNPDGWYGNHTDQWGRYVNCAPGVDCRYPGDVHTYNSLEPFPPEWFPQFPKGGYAIVEHSCGTNREASIAQQKAVEGFACTMYFDITKAVEGHVKLTSDDEFYYHGGVDAAGAPIKAQTNDAPNTGVDLRRGGHWSFPRTFSGYRGGYDMCWTDGRTGRVASYKLKKRNPANPAQTFDLAVAWGAIIPCPDEDCLIFIGGGTYDADVAQYPAPEVFVIDYPDANGVMYATPVKQGANFPMTKNSAGKTRNLAVGYMGMEWCSHPKVGKFVGLDFNTIVTEIDGEPVAAGSAVRIVTLQMPPVGQRKSGEWQWGYEYVRSTDGSTLHLKLDAGTQNGVFGAFNYVPMANPGTEHEDGLFTLIDDASEPGKTFRLPSMTR